MENNQQNKENEKVFTSGDVSVLLERIDHNVKIIAEGHQILTRNIDEINTKLEKLDVIEGKLDAIEIKLSDKADQKVVDEHEQRVVKLEKAVATA